MMALTVVARVVAKQGCAESLKGELLKLIAPTRSETGCLQYTLHQDNDDPAVFIFYETWENPACLEAHMQSEHFQSYVAAVDTLLAEKGVFRMTRIA